MLQYVRPIREGARQEREESSPVKEKSPFHDAGIDGVPITVLGCEDGLNRQSLQFVYGSGRNERHQAA